MHVAACAQVEEKHTVVILDTAAGTSRARDVSRVTSLTALLTRMLAAFLGQALGRRLDQPTLSLRLPGA